MEHWIFVIMMFSLYLLPGIIAYNRRHKNTAAIFMLSIVLGWTMIAWLAALVWSMTDNRRSA